jgi:CheY-like chemotaxis protein
LLDDRSAAGDMTHKTILLVEDDLEIRDVMQDLLEDQGYDVVPAANGKQAIDYLTLDQQSRPDLMILDLMTPIVTGWQVLQTVRQQPALAQLPVIVISASRTDRPTGAAAFLRKPFRLDKFFETVRHYLGA